MTTLSTLRDLRRWAYKEGYQSLLEEPVEGYFSSLEAAVRDKKMLRHLVREHECRTLGEALDHPSGDPCLRERPVDARSELLVSIARWIADRAAGVPAIPPPPPDVGKIRAWAAQHGVIERLEDPVTVLAPRVAPGLRPLLLYGTHKPRIEHLLAGTARLLGIGPTRHQEWQANELVRTARRYLHDAANGVARQAAQRRALDARAVAPTEPALRGIFERLAAAREARAEGVPRRPVGTYTPESITLALEPLRFFYREAPASPYGDEAVEVALWIEGPQLAVACARCPEGARCDHALAAIDAAMDLLRDPQQRAVHARIVEELSTPAWSRFLDAVARGTTRAAASEDQRLAFVVQESPLDIQAVVQRTLKRGGWSVGQRIAWSDLARRRELLGDERDARAVEILGEALDDDRYVMYSATRTRSRVARGLAALVGHPRVFLSDSRSTPVRIERARLTLSFDPCEGGDLAPALSLGNRRLRPDQISAASMGTPHVILFDAVASAIVVATLDERAIALLAAMEKFPARFPPESHDELVRRLEPVQESVRIELPESVRGEPIAAEMRPVVRLSPDEGPETEVAIRMRPIEGGPIFPPGEGPPEVLHSKAGRRFVAQRALAEETAIATAMAERLPLPDRAAALDEPGDARWTWRMPSLEGLLDLLAALRALGDEVVVEWPDPKQRVDLGAKALRSALKLRITDKRDWFGVDGEVTIDDHAVSLAALLEAVRSGRRYVQVGPNRFAQIEEDLQKQLRTAADLVFQGRHGLEVGLPAAAALTELVDDPEQLVAVARFRDLMRRIDASRALDPAVPETLTAKLRPYQVEGFRWLSRLAAWGMGGCLADDMGLGKTVQALALLIARATEGPALVIAPTSVGPNWLSEAARFAPGLRVRLYRGAGRSAMLDDLRAGDLLVTSYGLATRDVEALSGVRFATLILDEAQAIKNALTRRARAVRDLDADFRIALTGTPVENHLGELWSLMRILAPGLFGSWEQFRDRFAAPIERAHDPERRAALARALRPFLLRRTKDEVAPELPARTEISRVVDLSAAERRLYTEARDAALAAIASGEGDARFILLAALTRLRRLACHPRLYDEGSPVPSSKLNAMLEIVRELREEGHRALVFSQFTSHLALVREALDAEGITYAYLDGSTPSEERTRRIAAFQAGHHDLFLISLKAGGTGLNLTAANYVIHMDPWWNPAVEDQATDRAHRIGQTKPVTVVRLIARGTIEETVVSIHGEKRALAAGVFDEEGGPARLSVEDLAGLIRSGAGASGEAFDDDAGDALGAEIVAEEEPSSRRSRVAAKLPAASLPPALPPASLPPAATNGGSPAASPPAPLPKVIPVDVLANQVLDRLAAEKQIVDRRYDSTLRTYERSLRRFGEYVAASAHERAFQQEPAAVIDGYLDALRTGLWPAPASEPQIARAVMNHVRAFLAERAGD